MSDPVLSPSERLLTLGYHADTLIELLEEFADTDGVITSESARHFWQKVMMASLGHAPHDQAAAMEKLWSRLGRLTLVQDPALPVDTSALIDSAFTEADALWKQILDVAPTPAALCLLMARLTGLAAEALAATDRSQ